MYVDSLLPAGSAGQGGNTRGDSTALLGLLTRGQRVLLRQVHGHAQPAQEETNSFSLFAKFIKVFCKSSLQKFTDIFCPKSLLE